jgi:hypothetical protein
MTDAELLDYTAPLSADDPGFSALRVCPVCGLEFETAVGNKMCCSVLCSEEYHNHYHKKSIATGMIYGKYTVIGYTLIPPNEEDDYMDFVGHRIAHFDVSLGMGVIPTGLIVEDGRGERRMVDGKRLVEVAG